MAGSKYEYVKEYEPIDNLLKSVFIVLRVDGRGFTKFTQGEGFVKPNDDHGLWLMAVAALDVLRLYDDCILAYGQSDEYSFVFRLNTDLFGRRCQKILSTVVSTFTAAYVKAWLCKKPPADLEHPSRIALPTFDGRITLYPSLSLIKDYLAWRQADCHINNLYNYCFWLRVKKSLAELGGGDQSQTVITPEQRRKVHQKIYAEVIQTDSAQKNEILFQEFNINYNKLPQLHRKGTMMWRTSTESNSDVDELISPISIDVNEFDVARFARDEALMIEKRFIIGHMDIISPLFWKSHQSIEKKLLS